MNNALQQLLNPERIAVIGASNSPGKLGYLLLQNLTNDFSGDVYPINPGLEEIRGFKTYPKVSQAPLPPDLAILATPPSVIPEIISDCIKAKTGVAVILSGGFSETGAKGSDAEREILALARRGNLRLLGPNCFGVVNTGIGLNASLSQGLPKTGGVSLITQSGAYGMAAFSCSQSGTMGFAKVIAPGNKIDIDEIELLRYLRDDQETKVVAMVLESISRGRALFDEIRQTVEVKPVVILKTARFAAGKRAAESHTAAMASDYVVTAAALKQAGAHLVTDGHTLLEVAATLEKRTSVSGHRAAIITNSGGTGVELADLLEEYGLTVPKLSDQLQSRIRKYLPDHGSAANPIDVTTQWDRFAEMYGKSLKYLLASDEIDIVVLIMLQRSALMSEVTDAIIKVVNDVKITSQPKSVHICWVASSDADVNKRKLLANGISVHDWPLRTALTIANCIRRRLSFQVKTPIGEIQSRPKHFSANTWLPDDDCYRLLESTDISIPPWKIAPSKIDLAKMLETCSFPLVLKAIRADLQHKSDRGGVKLDLGSTREVLYAADWMENQLGAGPYLVQKQVKPGVELILGAVRDPDFGLAVVFGIGGIFVELFNDTSIRLAPVSVEEAQSMLDEIQARRLLDGYRGGPVIDAFKLAELISDFSIWVTQRPWIDQIDINPLIADGSEFIAVDLRIHLSERGLYD